jgi:hypothetical protein
LLAGVGLCLVGIGLVVTTGLDATSGSRVLKNSTVNNGVSDEPKKSSDEPKIPSVRNPFTVVDGVGSKPNVYVYEGLYVSGGAATVLLDQYDMLRGLLLLSWMWERGLTCTPQKVNPVLDDLAAPVERVGLLCGACGYVLGW